MTRSGEGWNRHKHRLGMGEECYFVTLLPYCRQEEPVTPEHSM